MSILIIPTTRGLGRLGLCKHNSGMSPGRYMSLARCCWHISRILRKLRITLWKKNYVYPLRKTCEEGSEFYHRLRHLKTLILSTNVIFFARWKWVNADYNFCVRHGILKILSVTFSGTSRVQAFRKMILTVAYTERNLEMLFLSIV